MRKLIVCLLATACVGLADAQFHADDAVGVAGSDPTTPKAMAVQGVTGGKDIPVTVPGPLTLTQPVTVVDTSGADLASEATLAAQSAAQATAALQSAANALLTTIAGLDYATETTLTAQATAALQSAANALLTTIAGLDFATETTLTAQATAALQSAANALLTTISTLDYATETTLSAQSAAQATAALQIAANALLTTMDATLTTIAGLDYATETTLAAQSAAQATAALQTAANALLTTISTLDYATETTLAAQSAAQATSALQSAANALLTTIAGLDYATETTLTAQSTAALQTAANALLTTMDGYLASMAPDIAQMELDLIAINTQTLAGSLSLDIIDDWDATSGGAISPDGPQVMGHYDSTKPTPADDGDAVQMLADGFGRLLPGVETASPDANVNSADATSATQLIAKSAAQKYYLTSVTVSTDTAMNITLQDDNGAPVVLWGPHYFAANTGAPYTIPLSTPIDVATNQDLDFITSVAGNVTVTVTGYRAP